MSQSTAPTQMPDEHSMRALLKRIALLPGKIDRPVTGLADDSRRVRPGDLFIARPGRRSHGAEHLDQAIEAGAIAALVDIEGPVVRHVIRAGVPVIGVPGLAAEVGTIASRFHGEPSRAMTVIGITGTNGKTSVSQLLAHALQGQGGNGHGRSCGVIGTLGHGLYGELEPASHTTPGPLELQAILAGLRDSGVDSVVMEVSSHALDQYRADGVAIDVAVFTNLSHEHLDYHGDLASYAAVKRRLFLFPGLQQMVINADDEYGRKLLANPPGNAQRVSFGLEAAHQPQVLGSRLRLGADGIRLWIDSPWGSGELHSPLLGRFNASNLLAAVATLGCLPGYESVSLDTWLQRLGQVSVIAGRMEVVTGGAGQPLVVVDYAHTPDALQQVLTALRGHTRGRLWCVFGCGGERDQAKRAVMGDIAERFADRVVVTWDNPRNEEPGTIVGQILGGMDQPTEAHVERDRGIAIAYAIAEADADDLVLIAGKGHEDYQLIGDRRLDFSDRGVAQQALEVAHG